MDHTTLCLAIENGMTLLTPNRRLAADWHDRYAHTQAALGKTAFKTPVILPLTTWLSTLYEQAALDDPDHAPTLLTKIMSQYLWEREVQSTLDHIPLLQPAKTAQLLQAGHRLCLQWRLTLNDPRLIQTPEDETANGWMRHYEAQCQNNAWLDPEALPQWLISRLPRLKAILPTHLALVGFNEFTPQQNAFIEALKANNVNVTVVSIEGTLASCWQVSLQNETDEWLTAARFAKATREKHPDYRIGIVVPDLENSRDRVLHALKRVFNPNEFNLSAGKRLPEYPIIQSALNFLALHHGKLSSDEITQLLNSPFLGDAENEQVGRALLDATRREHNLTQLHLKYLSPLQESWFQRFSPRLWKRLTQFYAALAPLKKQSMAKWAETMNHLLTLLGWPGERILNSDEYQIVQAWLKCLADCQSLTPIAGDLSVSEALAIIRLAAHQSVFQPQTPPAAIQVLGLLEASGMAFDVLWVSGLDDLRWPPAPKPNPFLPKRLQRELSMPHATAERELLYCQTMMHQFKQSAKSVYFSYANVRDLTPREPSALINAFPPREAASLELASLPVPHEDESALTELVDECAPSIHTAKLNGGVSLIKNQALCPFRAFAEGRLEAKPLAEPEPGLLAKDRGILLHSALESVWQKIETQATLKAMDLATLEGIITEAIQLAMNSTTLPYAKTSKYMALERKRLHALIMEWLALEKQRPPFRVLSHEKSVSVVLGEMTLAARIDRIDVLEDGHQLIIDYKTGLRNHIRAWFDERPEQPQLPLYTLVDPDNTAGIAFAEVHSKGCGFKGLSKDEIGIPGIKPDTDWNAKLSAWRTTLTAIAFSYTKGEAYVDPKHGALTCEHCSLGGFCRIKEQEAAYVE